MASELEIDAYLTEHLPYMLKMLRYTSGQLEKSQHYLSANAHFESFAVNARNLALFLTSGDGSNFKARDFTDSFKPSNRDQINGRMQKLRDQVFHLGKRRPKDVIGKLVFDDVPPVKDWIESNFEKFILDLAPTRRAKFDRQKSEPEEGSPVFISVEGLQQQACTASVSGQTLNIVFG
jgi:hypothetical protein